MKRPRPRVTQNITLTKVQKSGKCITCCVIGAAKGEVRLKGGGVRLVWSDPLRNGRSDELLVMSLSWKCDQGTQIGGTEA